MAHFYGKLQGSRGEVTRCGTKNSGLTTVAAGWGGAIEVTVRQDSEGNDVFEVALIPWQGSGGRRYTLSQGVLDSGAEMLGNTLRVVPKRESAA